MVLLADCQLDWQPFVGSFGVHVYTDSDEEVYNLDVVGEYGVMDCCPALSTELVLYIPEFFPIELIFAGSKGRTVGIDLLDIPLSIILLDHLKQLFIFLLDHMRELRTASAIFLIFFNNLTHLRLRKLHLAKLLMATSLHILHDMLLSHCKQLDLHLQARSYTVLAQGPAGNQPELVLVACETDYEGCAVDA